MAYQRIVLTKFGAPDVLQLVSEAVLPEPKAGEVRVKVLAASVSFTDTMIRTGSYLEVRDKPPFTPGYDAVGVVDAVGDGVVQWQVGNHVAALTVVGGYSQYIVLPASALVAAPKELDSAVAATMVLSYTTAYQMLHRSANMQAGQTALVHAGSGAVGMALLELARLAGVKTITTASASKREMVEALGAAAIDYKTQDFVNETMLITNGKGVNAAFDTIGFDYFKRSFACLNRTGKLVAYGVYNATAGKHDKRGNKVLGDVAKFYGQRLKWKLTNWQKSADFYVITHMQKKHPEWFRQDMQTLFQWALAGKIRPRIHAKLPLAQAAQAHTWVEQAIPQGKVVLLPWE